MPPKRNDKKSNANLNPDNEHEELLTHSPTNELEGKMVPLEDILDRRFRQHSKQINDLFVKLFVMLKKELDEATKRQDYLSSKFDGLVSSVDGMHEPINTIKAENMELRERVTMLESQITTTENES